MLKKISSALIIFMLVLSSLSVTSFASGSGDVEPNAPGGNVSNAEELIAALGGNGITFNNGIITLIKDVVLSSTVNITEGVYVIVGEGAQISGAFDGDLFVISGEGTTLTLGDIASIENKSDLVIEGNGKVNSGSLFKTEQGAILEMYNSVKLKNAITSASGAAVYSLGQFTMYGGEIEGCRAVSNGGAIYSEGNLTLAGGHISGCSANNGGAVYSMGKSTVVGTSLKACLSTNGGAIYNTGDMQFMSATVTECTATKGGAIYNSGSLNIKGGAINKNKAENGDGGGIYNVSELELSGSVLTENSAQNGGNIYNAGNATTKESFMLYSGSASKLGGNIYNSELGIFTQNSGSVTLGRAIYGGGVFNLGTYNLNGGGIYANLADVAQGLLNHGKVVLSGMGYCEKGDDLFVVLTPDNKHSILVSENWEYSKKPVSVSCGKYDGGSYSYSHSVGDKLLDVKGKINVEKRFILHVKDTGLVIRNNGTLKIAPTPISKTLVTVICVILAYPLVTAAIVFAIRYFDKKKLA